MPRTRRFTVNLTESEARRLRAAAATAGVKPAALLYQICSPALAERNKYNPLGRIRVALANRLRRRRVAALLKAPGAR